MSTGNEQVQNPALTDVQIGIVFELLGDGEDPKNYVYEKDEVTASVTRMFKGRDHDCDAIFSWLLQSGYLQVHDENPYAGTEDEEKSKDTVFYAVGETYLSLCK